MDKNAIKKYAVWARRELISRVSQRAERYGITEKDTGDINATSVNGHVLSETERKQRQALIGQIHAKNYEQVMEEVAYTWFNRFSALRFMEVNGYLPSHVRVFTDDENNFKPQILTEAINLEIDGIDMEKVYALKNANDNDELFKYLIITQCNALSRVLPQMFQEISDYTELLFPDNLLRDGSVLQQLIEMIAEEDFNVETEGQVEIIGWLYQYYNTDLFNAIFDGDKSRKSLTADDLPAATQLFTPDWAVRYMVENSLGRFWIDGHPDSNLKSEWTYYLDGTIQKVDIQQQINDISKKYSKIPLEEVRCIDPCVGSGHILSYIFDVLMQIYTESGYSNREAVKSIIENNIYGLDIDDRAVQLASFSVLMKAIQYDRRFLRRSDIPRPNVFTIKNSNTLREFDFSMFAECSETARKVISDFCDANEYGSILKVSASIVKIEELIIKTREIIDALAYGSIVDLLNRNILIEKLLPIFKVAKILTQRYEIVVTNPPYLGSPRMNSKLSSYIKKYYEEGKADFCTVMYMAIQQNFAKQNGFVSLITTNSWMYLKSFVKMREKTLNDFAFTSIVDYGTELFEGKIGHLPIIAWVARKTSVHEVFPSVRLVDFRYGRRDEKYDEYFNPDNRYYSSQDEFGAIDGKPIDYWLSEQVLKTFEKRKLESFVEIVSGMTTGDNDKYLRMWNEVTLDSIAFNKHDVSEVDLRSTKWIPYHKGGEQRKWYGNHEYVVNWSESKNFNRAKTTMTHVYLKPCITWSDISGNSFAGRYCSGGFMFDVKGSCAFGDISDLKVLIGLFNSKVTPIYVEALNPTSTTQVGDLKRIPFVKPDKNVVNRICELVDTCVTIAREDWDSFEFSWDFMKHPLIADVPTIREAYEQWENKCNNRIFCLKQAEEELNSIYITLYGLADTIVPDVEEADISIRKADLQREIRSFISYAVGCMLGRFSLDSEGIVYAGGMFNASQYGRFAADKDNILPICNDDYFPDDIVGQFVRFVEIVYGKNTLEENLRYIADALGGKGSARDIIRNYFLTDFYTDHLKVYQKRPIYWMFDSGKKNGFKALIYLHRYQADTIARLRTDYVHEQQSRYRTALADLERRISIAATSERVKLNKQYKILQEQSEEIRIYEEKIHHLADQFISIDLDDGVKKNYELFKDVLARLK